MQHIPNQAFGEYILALNVKEREATILLILIV